MFFYVDGETHPKNRHVVNTDTRNGKYIEGGGRKGLRSFVFNHTFSLFASD